MSTTTKLSFNVFTTNSNSSAGKGTMTLSGPDNKGWYSADVETLKINNKPAFSPEEIKGESSQCGGTTVIPLYTSQRNDLKIFLAKNPLESRVSYSGSLAYASGIYNLTAVVA